MNSVFKKRKGGKEIGEEIPDRLLDQGQLKPPTTGESSKLSNDDQAKDLPLQSSFGNANVARLLIQRKEGSETSGETDETSDTATSPGEATGKTAAMTAPVLIVADSAETIAPGQMRKSEFLAQLRPAVSSAVADSLADNPLSAIATPYIDGVLAQYAAQDCAQLERSIRRYAPEAASMSSAVSLIPLISGRVRRAVTTWITTGEVPKGLPLGLPGASQAGAVSDAVTGASGVVADLASTIGSGISAIGNVLFKERDGGAQADGDPQIIQSQLGAGHSLDDGVRARMEPAFGESFGGIQIHADSKGAGLSEDLNARAFTVGEHIAFGAGEYKPGTLIGDALIAHELAHVMQQRGAGAAGVRPKSEMESGTLETDADRAAVGAVVSTWVGTGKGLVIARNALPILKSGLRLQRCEDTKEKKEQKRLAGLQYEFMEKKRKEKEEKARKDAEEAATKSGQIAPKIEIEMKMEDVTADDMKEAKFQRESTDPWLIDIDDAARKNWTDVRAPAAWAKILESIKGTEIEPILKGKTYKFDPALALKEGAYAWQDETALGFGMAFIQNVEGPGGAKNVWPTVVHEMGGHFEYGVTHAKGIMDIVLEKMPEASRNELKNNTEKWNEFFLTYVYPETEIYSALRERRYSKPEAGPVPTYGGMDPDTNIEIRLNQMRKVLHPEVAKAVLTYLRERVNASPDILERDKKYFAEQVKLKFGF